MSRQYGIAERVRNGLDRAFQERELYIRRDGEVRFMRLRRPLQVGIALVVLALLVWLGSASLGVLFLDRSIDQRDQRIAAMTSAYAALRTQSSENEARLSEIARELEIKHALLARAIEQRRSLNDSLDNLAEELTHLDRRRSAAEQANDTLRGRLSTLDRKVDRAVAADESAAVEDKIGRIIVARDSAVEDKRRLSTTIASLEARLSSLGEVEAKFQDLVAERDDAVARSELMASRVAQLESRLTRLKSSQDQLIARVQERTQSDLGEIEAAIALTGLDPSALLDPSVHRQRALGGPLFALASPHVDVDARSLDARFQTSIVHLEADLSRWAGIQGLLERLPLSSPLDAYYISSRFGKRRDPLTKRWAMHYGIDIAGLPKSSVLSTAPGKVTFVGRKGPYGDMVEIDHGHGLKTRYGHLRKILVKKGQEIDYRHQVGIMGSTGRSTGSHVHYEILHNGKPQDPSKFFKAGRYIFKG